MGLECCAPARRGGPGLAARSRARPPCGERGGAGPGRAALEPRRSGGGGIDSLPPAAGQGAPRFRLRGRGSDAGRTPGPRRKQTSKKKVAKPRQPDGQASPTRPPIRPQGDPRSPGSARLPAGRSLPAPGGAVRSLSRRARAAFPGARRAAAGRALAASAAELGVCLRGYLRLPLSAQRSGWCPSPCHPPPPPRQSP